MLLFEFDQDAALVSKIVTLTSQLKQELDDGKIESDFTVDQLLDYFQKYDVSQDPRNVSRELRGAVFEVPEDRGLKESKRLLERQFTAAAMPAALTVEDTETRLRARDRLMPEIDDYRRMYPKVLNSGAVCQPTQDQPTTHKSR